jgi:propionyl-CoA synthetase
MPGYDLHVLSPGLDHTPCHQNGKLFLKLPLPLGTLTTLWNDDADAP